MTDKLQKRIFGRRQGRPLNKSRVKVIETLLPKLSVPEKVLREDGQLAPFRYGYGGDGDGSVDDGVFR